MAITIDQLRTELRQNYLADEAVALTRLIDASAFTVEKRAEASSRAAELVTQVRENSSATMMENFLAEYGLSTREGVALMCLAEALLRVPDATTIDALIEDKVAYGEWRGHLGHSASALVNSSTWALMLTGKLIAPSNDEGITSTLRGLVKRMGEPVVRTAVGQAMKELGRQFVLGRNIQEATKRAARLESQGYTYSYDMLGEAACTESDAHAYLDAYSHAIRSLAPLCVNERIADNPGISVKLSALHPRYEFAKRDRVMGELVDRTIALARQAAQSNMGFNIDAEEADRLDLSLDVIEAVLSDPKLEGWDGFGVVVQAFGPRASYVIDWLYALATRLNRRIMIRLVKGAYWDAEIKRAQTLGLEGFPVYTRKVHSDISYLCCAEKLLAKTDRIYPQFATHNAHSVAAVLTMAKGLDQNSFEFQRLHGMGESLHDKVLTTEGTRCRVYAPVGEHRDLLAYLVRRLLENGANSSFVNQIVDTDIAPETIAKDPFEQALADGHIKPSSLIKTARNLYGEERINAIGWDITDPIVVEQLEAARQPFRHHQWKATPLVGTGGEAPSFDGEDTLDVVNPADTTDAVGTVITASANDVERAIECARAGFEQWSGASVEDRAACLDRVAEVYEENAPELLALAAREAGKTLEDGVGEIREAVDFARYYAQQARSVAASAQKEAAEDELHARGVITCISPWNFPLAIFTGQILAAVAAGNTVLAKPADQTPLMAMRAVELMHAAGIPQDVVQLLPGSGAKVGAALTSDSRIDGVCFTGSTATATQINRVMARTMAPHAPLIAETGGLNAMMVDSTALPEQVVRDVVASAFQSAGQRCSALRIMYVQEDIADNLLEMLFGAMDELQPGNAWALSTDVGPVIDTLAKNRIDRYCEEFRRRGQVVKSCPVPETGLFVSPTVIRVSGIEEMDEEIFGPVLHVATFQADQIDQVIDAVNNRGYGLTFGLHTRMDARIEQVTRRIRVGNAYVNRNQIGAIVGSQPFGGEGLSGTGPKAGGPSYLKRFLTAPHQVVSSSSGIGASGGVSAQRLSAAIEQLKGLQGESDRADERAIEAVMRRLTLSVPVVKGEPEELPGPTGELNRLSVHARGIVVCSGPDVRSALTQMAYALMANNQAVVIAPGIEAELARFDISGASVVALDGELIADTLTQVNGYKAIISQAGEASLRQYRIALSEREGELLPLVTESTDIGRYQIERHLCIDTTAAGGNASLIAAAE